MKAGKDRAVTQLPEIVTQCEHYGGKQHGSEPEQELTVVSRWRLSSGASAGERRRLLEIIRVNTLPAPFQLGILQVHAVTRCDCKAQEVDALREATRQQRMSGGEQNETHKKRMATDTFHLRGRTEWCCYRLRAKSGAHTEPGHR